MWSVNAASATNYEIVHAAGGFRLTDGNTYRKVIRHNINQVDEEGDSARGNSALVNNPPYVGRIILWD